MKKLTLVGKYYKIWQLGKEDLHELAEFVVRTNYTHHADGFSSDYSDEVESVYKEELRYADDSEIYAVRKTDGKIIGSIRVFKWDRIKPLPMQKLFNVNPLSAIHTQGKTSFWHIGRFAIDSFAGIPTLTLFKQLMILAIQPIVSDERSYMLAEVDSKLLKVLTTLGIKTDRLGKSLNYLASETIPVCARKEGLMQFYQHYRNLCIAS